MKIEEINNEIFSYKNYHKFSNNQYILAVKDEDFPDRNIIPILYNDNGCISNIDFYDMDKILLTRNSYMEEVAPFSERFMLHQLIKLSYGSIIKNDRWDYESSYPKCLTFQTNAHELEYNEVIEIFEGIIEESKGRIKLSEKYLESLITEVYIENNTPFFIMQNSKLIGPLKAIEKDLEGFFKIEKSSWNIFGEYSCNKESFFEFNANQITRRIIIPSNNNLSLIKELDFKSDNEILLDFKNNLIISNLEVTEQEQIFKANSKAKKQKSIKNYINKNKRLQKLLKETEDIIISDLELAKVIPEISIIKDEIDKISNHKFSLKKESTSLKAENEKLKLEINDIEHNLNDLKKELEDINKTKELELLNVKSELENDIKELIIKKNEIIQCVDIYEIQLDLKDLEAEKRVITRDVKQLEENKRILRGATDELRQDNLIVQKDAQKQLTELFRHKKHFDFLSGRDLSELNKNNIIHCNDYSICSEKQSYLNYTEFRDDVSRILIKHGRKLDIHFIDNLLISIHQNTLTILAGLPGTGKTSLARILVDILTPKGRSTEVSVNRGWTSQKDLIGFQNPLSNKFHSAPTGVYDILKQLDYEITNNKYNESPLAYIILDEANLSPMEHYWSTFYNLTDSFARKSQPLKIEIGDSTKLEYANNLRFIATINCDQTTETLSPRVIDRANIIRIPQNTNIDSIIEITTEDIEHLKFTYEKCRNYFDLVDYCTEKKTFEISEELYDIYNEIKLELSNVQIFISPRVELSIKRYCSVASEWMRETSRPLDYCISQRVLPLINIQGEKAKLTLGKLVKTCKDNDLKCSQGILEQILLIGGDADSFFEGNYNYFLTLSHAQNI